MLALFSDEGVRAVSRWVCTLCGESGDGSLHGIVQDALSHHAIAHRPQPSTTEPYPQEEPQ